MSTDYDADLLKEGILHFKSGEFDMARNYFERALDSADDQETRASANYYLSKVTDDPAMKRNYLEETLAIDFTHAEARRALAILDGKLKPEDIVNPEALTPENPGGTETVKADRFVCPRCGGRMVYAPDGMSLVCEYCQRTQKVVAAAEGQEHDFFIAMANGQGFRKTVSMKSFQCQGCGAAFLLAPQELSATCAYCGSVHVLAQEDKRDLLEPDCILPMEFDQKQAGQRLVDWVEKNHLTPEEKVPFPRGLYLPVWTFDLFGDVPWSGFVIRNKQRVPVSGAETVNWNNLPVPASKNQAALLRTILPGYPFASASAYDPRYLAGWAAEIYELSMSDSSLDARSIAVAQVRSSIFHQSGDVLDLKYSASSISVVGFKLVLVPVWFTHIKARGQTGKVLINGHDGSISSELPLHGFANWLDHMMGS